MATIDEIKRMERDGKREDEIMGELKSRGIGEREIAEAMSQSRIKDAVNSGGDFGATSDVGDNGGIPPIPQEPPMQSQEETFGMLRVPSPNSMETGEYYPGRQEESANEYVGQEGGGEYAGMQTSMLGR
jgi:hypothetical protein